MDSQNMFVFVNEGPELIETNYWDSEHAKKGYAHLSINAGCFRLLLPKDSGISIEEMKTGEIVLVTRGAWPEKGRRDGLELLFEDHTNYPFMVRLTTEQCDRLPLDKDCDRPGQDPRWTFALYNEDGKLFDWPARYRKAASIPYMKAWED